MILASTAGIALSGCDVDAVASLLGEPAAPTPPEAPPGTTKRYYTAFAGGDEDPISEKGAWIHGTDATYFHRIKILGGRAVATHNASPRSVGKYDDSTARLTGDWPPDQEAIATVWRKRGVYNGEVEISLRVSDGPNTLRMYECLANIGGGVSIVRWNGPPGDITFLDDGKGLRDPGKLENGDKVRGRIIAQTITFWFARAARPTDWVLIGSVTDDSPQRLTGGNPGMAFFKRADVDPARHFERYGFRDFAAFGF